MEEEKWIYDVSYIQHRSVIENPPDWENEDEFEEVLKERLSLLANDTKKFEILSTSHNTYVFPGNEEKNPYILHTIIIYYKNVPN